MPAQSQSTAAIVYKICRQEEWRGARDDVDYAGSADDQRDGFIHLSASPQLAATLARHFDGQTDLVLIAFASADLGPALRWEVSRGGELFPHVYGTLPVGRALHTWTIGLHKDGTHVLPDLLNLEPPRA